MRLQSAQALILLLRLSLILWYVYFIDLKMAASGQTREMKRCAFLVASNEKESYKSDVAGTAELVQQARDIVNVDPGESTGVIARRPELAEPPVELAVHRRS